jgi:hypothetical protein
MDSYFEERSPAVVDKLTTDAAALQQRDYGLQRFWDLLTIPHDFYNAQTSEVPTLCTVYRCGLRHHTALFDCSSL